VRRHAVVLLALLAACKGKHDGAAGSGSATTDPHARPIDASIVVPVDWKACDNALRKAATEPLDVRPALVIDGCKVCGDWTPLLRWATPQAEKGPTRFQIEDAMARCGYCSPNAKQRFLGTLDNARGTNTRTPWRYLGEMCKAEVSAVPDNRFTTAPFYALDRIARAASAHGGETANLLAAIELPLPAVTVTGVGMVLPDLDGGVQPTAGPLSITLIGDALHVAKLPRAHLGAGGVTVELGNYPGDEVKLADLGGALTKLANGDKTVSITLVIAHATPAEKLIPIIAAASTVAPIYLAANAPGSPEGWDLPGTIPVALEAGGPGRSSQGRPAERAGKADDDTIAIKPEMTVQNLATELAKRAKAGQKKASLAAKK